MSIMMMIKEIHLHRIVIVLFWLLCIKTSFLCSESVPEATTMVVRCIERERQALLVFKQGLVDNYDSLSSWGSEEDKRDCCGWRGVQCDNRTGHVTQLHLSFLNNYYYVGSPCNRSTVSPSLLELQNLNYLDLSNNYFGGMPIPNFIGSLTNLVHLDLSGSNFSGFIPYQLRNLSKLHHLDLSHNDFGGIPIPNFIGSLTNLVYLDLSSTNFSRVIPYQLGNLSKLRHLDLSSNQLEGSLPDFKGFSSLEELFLNDNELDGCLPDFTGCSSLRVLQLSVNQFTEWETKSIGQLSKLELLDISKNSLGSVISEQHLSNLSSLKFLNISFNSLTFNLSSKWLPPFQLDHICLASCNLGPEFPKWIRTQSEFSYLDFSNSQISDAIPIWFWNLSNRMEHLNLSSNKIRGKFPTLSSKITRFLEVDLSSNYFDGPVPPFPSKCTKLNLSRNKFSGTLSFLSLVRDFMSLRFFDLSRNQIYAVLPDCWVYFQELVFLNLGYNNLSGRIPNSIGYMFSLQTLILRNNSFYGELPMSLRNCSKLGFMDVGLNNLSGNIPSWIGEDMTQLYALILRSNKFYGSIPYRLCNLRDLHFLDLSINYISGKIPQCFGNFTALVQKGNGITDHEYNSPGIAGAPIYTNYYVDDALAGWKGRELECGRNFAYLKSIDLSTNKLTGEIPVEITRLLELKGLNLSRNMFYGMVPKDIGLLKMLESLDLSRNQFSGEIPASMSELNFLSYLNLSNNIFSGKIPLGTQLQGFDVSSYDGNDELCGSPLPTKCFKDDEAPLAPPSSGGIEDDENEYERWFYISAAVGFITTFWGICGTLLLNHRWRDGSFSS